MIGLFGLAFSPFAFAHTNTGDHAPASGNDIQILANQQVNRIYAKAVGERYDFRVIAPNLFLSFAIRGRGCSRPEGIPASIPFSGDPNGGALPEGVPALTGANFPQRGHSGIRNAMWTVSGTEPALLCFDAGDTSGTAATLLQSFVASIAQPNAGEMSEVSLGSVDRGTLGITGVGQWQRCTDSAATSCTDVGAANALTYTPTADDATGNGGSGYYLRAMNVGYRYTPPSGFGSVQTGSIAAVTSSTAVVANTPPMVVGRVENFALTVGENREVQARFSDMGDTFTCRAESDQPNFASVTNVSTTSDPVGCELTVNAESPGTATITVTADDGEAEPVSQSFVVTVNAPPSAESSSSSGGVVLLAIAGAGAYLWWKKRQIANGNAAKMALLPDVSFDLDRRDERAFYTRMNWQNAGNSNWQLRSAFNLHTKYSGELLDWNADSHIGYRLNGKLGEFNPYLHGKFVQNAPENAKMDETYTLGVNYAVPNRFSVQFLQPDDEIWRYSLKMQVHLPKNISLQLNQPNSDLANYAFGVSWRKSKIRYGISGETGGNSYRLSGEFSF